MARVNRRTAPAVLAATVAITVAACGGERNFDNPPEVPIGTASSTTSTGPTSTVFVPSTAPTTVAPPTNPPPPTAAPTYAQQTAPPTQATIPTSPVPTTGERYTIVRGDTLSGISQKLGVSLADLLAANGLNENSLIVPGDQLSVPQGGSVPATQAPRPATSAPPPATAAPPAATAAPPAGTTAAPAATNAPPATTAAPRAPTTTFAAPAGAVVPTELVNSCQAPQSTEADGTPIDFSPGNVIDRNPATAWRCEVADMPTSITFSFDQPTRFTSVGLIGGYVKVDPLTGVDRFTQNHRVRQVRWTFDDGSSVTQDLSDARNMQTLPVDVTATSVKMEILATYPPGGEAPRQMVPVAEVQFTTG